MLSAVGAIIGVIVGVPAFFIDRHQDKVEAARVLASPCVRGEIVCLGAVAMNAPRRKDVFMPTSWCAAYKPGREGESP